MFLFPLFHLIYLKGLWAQFPQSLSLMSTDFTASQWANFPIKENKVLKWKQNLYIVSCVLIYHAADVRDVRL